MYRYLDVATKNIRKFNEFAEVDRKTLEEMVDKYNLGWDKSELTKEILAGDLSKIRNQMEKRSLKQMAGNLNI